MYKLYNNFLFRDLFCHFNISSRLEMCISCAWRLLQIAFHVVTKLLTIMDGTLLLLLLFLRKEQRINDKTRIMILKDGGITKVHVGIRVSD